MCGNRLLQKQAKILGGSGDYSNKQQNIKTLTSSVGKCLIYAREGGGETVYSGFWNKIKIREPVFTLHVSAETKEVCGWYLNIFRYFNLVNASATNLF